MAKSARSSAIKKNKSALKKKVFGPVEAARNERLSAKLLELASKPRIRAQMDVDETGMPQQRSLNLLHTDPDIDGIAEPNDSTNTSSEGKEDQATKGASSSLSIPIPACLLYHNDQLPSPPTTPILDTSVTNTPILERSAQKEYAKELLFFHLLGASSDIVGFDDNGQLELSFAGPG